MRVQFVAIVSVCVTIVAMTACSSPSAPLVNPGATTTVTETVTLTPTITMPTPTVTSGTVLHKFGQQINEMDRRLTTCTENIDQLDAPMPDDPVEMRERSALSYVCLAPDTDIALLMRDIADYAESKNADRYDYVIEYARSGYRAKEAMGTECFWHDYIIDPASGCALDWGYVTQMWSNVKDGLLRLDTE